MRTRSPKKVKKMKVAPLVKKSQSKPKKSGLSKSDPDYFSKIGAISAAKRKLSPAIFSEMARLSHKKRPKSSYRGGRPKNPPADE